MATPDSLDPESGKVLELKTEGLGIGHKVAIILLGTTLLALLVTGTLYYLRNQRELVGVAVNHLHSVAQHKAALISQIVKKNRERSALIASRTQLRISLSEWLEAKASGDAPNPQVQEKMRKILFDAKQSVPEVSGIAIADLRGEIVVSTEPQTMHSRVPERWVSETAAAKQMQVHVARRAGARSSLVVTDSLYLEGVTLGVLILETDASDLAELARTHSGLGLTEETVIVYRDESGALRAVVPLKFAHGPEVTPAIDPFKLAASSTPETRRHTDYRGREVFAVADVFPDLGWGMVYKIDADEALAVAAEQRRFLIWSLLVVGIATIAVAAALARTITKPIVDLTYVATMIASGDLSKRMRRMTKDELGLLATAFNQMADKLIQAQQLLEHRVREKTEELSKANESLAKANRDLEQLSLEDPLTGVANRRAFDQRLSAEWKRCARDGTLLGLMMIDVDFFKRYNDTLGHAAGDECLAAVAAVLRQCVKRDGDLVARYGGEEFAVLLPGTRREDCLALAKEIQAALKDRAIPHPSSEVGEHITFSVGAGVRVPEARKAPGEFLEVVDAALYEAKEKGRNTVVEVEA